VLLVLTGLAGRECKGRIACLAAAGAIGGVPLVAIGITATQLGYGPLLECLAAWGMASAGLLSAGLHFQLAYRGAHPARARGLWAIAAIGLSVGMIYAVLYGSRAYLPLAWVTLPWMRAVHGSANALGFGLAATVAWLIAMRRVAAPDVVSSLGKPGSGLESLHMMIWQPASHPQFPLRR
ncbi:MAG: YndJ family transporter, partial [Candidatus Tectomicrobia bacterium]